MSETGNLIVVAGAGAGKTYKLVEAVLQRLRAGARIDEMLVVTFTKAAASELRGRIGKALQEAHEKEASAHLAQQIALLDRALISTLHSFCLELVSRHFSELGLAPRLQTLEAAPAAVLENEALDQLFETYYEAKSPRALAAKKFLLDWFKGDDVEARRIVRKIHSFTQARPHPQKWFAEQRAFLSDETPSTWRQRHAEAISDWAHRWRSAVEAQPSEGNPARPVLLRLIKKLNVSEAARVPEMKDLWPRGTVGKFRDPLEKLFDEAKLLAGWLPNGESDPLAEDWRWTRHATLDLLQIAQEFGEEFAKLKRERGLVDFNDLEQFSLQLLWDGEKPSATALHWRQILKFIFVDEYQDINRAQDQIIHALAGTNRFLVGDVKQSIYGFRQAEPRVFLDYQKRWEKNDGGRCEYLVRNWRSHERILDFVNGLFGGIMTIENGGVAYDDRARLVFADEPNRAALSAKLDPTPKVDIHMIASDPHDETDEADALADMEAGEAEGEAIAQLCEQMVAQGQGTFGDIVILMRSAAGEVEGFAKAFSRRRIPFDARRSGFFTCLEVLDLTNLLTILDNPLQDIPLLGVLRSPIGSFSLEELAAARVSLRKATFWEALVKFSKTNTKAAAFVERLQKWRDLARQSSLAQRLEIVLEETGYEDWVLAQERGEQRRANVRRFIELARQFDETKGEGLYPFLQYMEEQTKAIGDIAAPTAESRGAVRLMTIHQSKGLQFPIVIVAGLRKCFNNQDLQGLVLLDSDFGLCLKARPPGERRQYETLDFWLAKRKQAQRLRNEEMRILYVALTRAEKRLILVASPKPKDPEKWSAERSPDWTARSMMDWIGPWLTSDCSGWIEADSGSAKDWTWQWHRDLRPTPEKPAPRAAAVIDQEKLAQLKERVHWKYPFLAATQQEAKTSATALRRNLSDEPELARSVIRSRPGKLKAEEAGQVAHRFLESARLESFGSLEQMRAELKRLNFADDEAESIGLEKLFQFWNSAFGKELLVMPQALRRELTFTAKFTADDLKSVGAPLDADFGADEFIVVQGAADLVSLREREIWLVDFKTDRSPARKEQYALQIRIYARALEKIYRKPVTRAGLHFLETNETVWIRQPGYLPLM